MQKANAGEKGVAPQKETRELQREADPDVSGTNTVGPRTTKCQHQKLQ